MKAKNLVTLSLAAGISAVSACCTTLQKTQKTHQELFQEISKSGAYIDLTDPNEGRQFFKYEGLDFKIKVDEYGKELYAYPKGQIRPGVPSFKCEKEKERIKEMIVGDVNFDHKRDIILVLEEYNPDSPGLYVFEVGKFGNIESWEWERKIKRIGMLEYLSEKGAKVLLNKGEGKFGGAVPLEGVLKNLPFRLNIVPIIPDEPVPSRLRDSIS